MPRSPRPTRPHPAIDYRTADLTQLALAPSTPYKSSVEVPSSVLASSYYASSSGGPPFPHYSLPIVIDPALLGHPSELNPPSGLQFLADGPLNDKPPYRLRDLMRVAIHGSPARMLTFQEIIQAIENRFHYYKTAGDAWKGTVRHLLSLHACFLKVTRDKGLPFDGPGRGDYWAIDPTAPDGATKRVRKRGPRKSTYNSQSDEEYE